MSATRIPLMKGKSNAACSARCWSPVGVTAIASTTPPSLVRVRAILRTGLSTSPPATSCSPIGHRTRSPARPIRRRGRASPELVRLHRPGRDQAAVDEVMICQSSPATTLAPSTPAAPGAPSVPPNHGRLDPHRWDRGVYPVQRGGAEGTRTPDPHTASVVRYQLRHGPARPPQQALAQYYTAWTRRLASAFRAARKTRPARARPSRCGPKVRPEGAAWKISRENAAENAADKDQLSVGSDG